jgi:hypothetical protein
MRADFHRIEGWAESAGIRAQPGRNGDSVFPLCRALVAAGIEDASLELYDERGVHCLTLDSIAVGARYAYAEDATGLRIGRWAPLPPGTFQKPPSVSRHSGKGHVG